MYQIRLVQPGSAPASIYDQSQIDDLPVLSPGCSLEINEAGSLHFTLIPGHPLINSLEPLASFMQALDDGEEIFYGRVISRSKPTLTGQVSFECEGAIAFLNDSEIAPYGKDADGKNITRTMTAEAFFRDCIAQHNAEVDDSRRQFTIGTISAAKKNESAEYGISSYTETKSAIESNILGVYGGFIRVRPGANGTHVIDWVENYDTVNPQAIQVGVNLEEQTNEEDGASVFTVLRPVGKDNLTLPEETIDLYSAADIAKYGRIVKTVTFSDAEDETTLRARATAYASNISATLFRSSNIRLVDMHYIDGMSPKIRLGDRFTNISGLSGITMVAASLELNFEAPQNDTLSLKDRKSLDPDGTQDGHGHGAKGAGKDNSSLTKATSSNRATTGQYFKYLREVGDMLEVTANEVYMHGQTLTQNYVDIQRNADNYLDLSNRTGSLESALAPIQQKWNDVEYAVTLVNGSAFVQNDSAIAQAAGMFELWEDPNTHKKTIHLKNGAAFAVDRTNGTTMTVGAEVEQLAATVSGQQALVSQMQGSALWAQANQILGVCGSYYIQRETVPDPEHDGETIEKQTLVLTNGGGMKIRQNGAEYGVYMTPAGETDAVLTGGIVIDKINRWTTTKISGDVVDISASQVQLRAGETLDSVVGHFQEEWYDYYDQGTYMGRRKRLVYKADGGMRVERLDNEGNVVSCGVWDDNNLTAGIIIQQINNERTVKIAGTKVDIRADQMESIGIYTENHFDAGFIVNRINDGANTQFVISADKIQIGTRNNQKVKLGDVLGVNANYITIAGDVYMGTSTLYPNNIGLAEGGYVRFLVGTAPPENVYVYGTDVKDMIRKAEVSGNNLKLWKRGNNTNTPDINFSKATSLAGVWSGGILTVTASPQNTQQTYGIMDLPAADITWTGNVASFPVKANLNGGETVYNTGKTLQVDATSIRTAGRNEANVVGTWSGGQYTAKNQYNNSRYAYTGIADCVASTDVTWNGYVASIEIKAFNDGSETKISTGKTITLDVTSKIPTHSPTLEFSGQNNDGTNTKFYVKPKCGGVDGSRTTIYLKQSGNRVYATTGNWYGESAYTLLGSEPVSTTETHSIRFEPYGVNNDGSNTMMWVQAICGYSNDYYPLYLKQSGSKVYLTTGNYFGDGAYAILGSVSISVSHNISMEPTGTNSNGTNTSFTAHAECPGGVGNLTFYLKKSGNRVYATVGNYFGDSGYAIVGSCSI